MINLKYSKDVKKDYEQLSDGRNKYINKRAIKEDISVSEYLIKKYGRGWRILNDI